MQERAGEWQNHNLHQGFADNMVKLKFTSQHPFHPQEDVWYDGFTAACMSRKVEEIGEQAELLADVTTTGVTVQLDATQAKKVRLLIPKPILSMHTLRTFLKRVSDLCVKLFPGSALGAYAEAIRQNLLEHGDSQSQVRCSL